LSVVSKNQQGLGQFDIATVFVKNVLGNDTAPRVMAGMIAVSIFGNIVVMTFTASRGETQSLCYVGYYSLKLTVSRFLK
jgi:hypothetical protein